MTQAVESLLLQVEATTALMRQELQRGEQALGAMERRTEQTANRMGTSFAKIGRDAGNSRVGFQQLGFQLQDVAAQAANGTSALTIFAQQGGQVAGALSLFGGTAGRVGAFLSGPWGVALAGAAVGLGVLTKGLFEARGAGEEAAKGFNTAADAAARYKEITDSLRAGSLTIQDQGEARLRLESLRGEREGLRSRIDAAGGPNAGGALIGEGLARLDQLNSEIGQLETLLRGVDVARRNTARLSRLSQAPNRTPARTAPASSARSSQSALSGAGVEQEFQSRLFQETAQRLSRDAGSPLKSVATELEALQPGINRVIDGATAGFRRLEGLSDNISRNLGQAIVNGQGLGTALVNSFKSVAAELIASGLFAVFRSLLGGSSFGSALSAGISAFGGGRANGGPVSGGRTYLVGERGPELFTPRAAGRIVNRVEGERQAVDVNVRASPDLVVTSVVAGQRGGAMAAGQIVRQATRGRIMSSRGA